MYKIVYTIADSEKLEYTNELMISLKSLRRWMPDCNVSVVVDNETYCFYKKENYPLLREADVISVHVPKEYTQKEKSRYLKTSLRKYVTGDYLFLDTDTVVCKQLPEKVSDAHIAMTLDYNCFVSERLDHVGVKALNSLCGLNIENIERYYNTGVMWVKDSHEAAEFYKDWHMKWKETRMKGFIYDQPAANDILRKKKGIFHSLDNKWNLQISVAPTPIGELKDAYVIHYFNIADSAYLLCDPSIKKLNYQDSLIEDIIENPYGAFSRCCLLKLDDRNIELLNSRSYKLLRLIQNDAHNIFIFNEKILNGLNKLAKTAKKKI